MTDYDKRWIGVDPGERWMGIAILTQIDKRTFTADMRVIDVAAIKSRNLLVNGLMYILQPEDSMVCENYQIRRAGHQSFDAGITLRIMGALEYAAGERGCEFGYIMPGKPEDINDMFFGKYLDQWQEKWMRPKADEWNHARSAWRALMIYLMARAPKVITQLRDAKTSAGVKHLRQPTPFFWPPSTTDLYTYPMIWEFFK